MWYVIPNDELYHHGILGQKWGIRRFQNPDGTLTAEGRKRYGVDSQGNYFEKIKINDNDHPVTKKAKNNYNNMSESEFFKKYSVSKKTYLKRVKKYGDPYMNSPLAKYGKKLQQKQKAIEKSGYSRDLRLKDQLWVGSLGVKSIAKKMQNGMDHKTALKKEIAKNIALGSAATVSVAAVSYLISSGAYKDIGSNVTKIINGMRGINYDRLGSFYDPSKDIVRKGKDIVDRMMAFAKSGSGSKVYDIAIRG